MAFRLHPAGRMRLLFALLFMMSFSSCLAMLGAGLFGSSLALAHSKEMKEGAERERRIRVLHAQEAAVIRQRYDAQQRQSPVAVQVEPTPPPLVPFEPVRTPLRPR